MAPPPDDPPSSASNRAAGPAGAADAPSTGASNEASNDASADASNEEGASEDASDGASEGASDGASARAGAASGAAPGGDDGGTFEKWMVRILLVLVFGVAFGIEGMTLLRSYLVETGGEQETASRVEEPPALRPGGELLPGTAPRATVAEMMVYVNPDAWTFTLRVEVANDTDRPYTLSFESLETENGRTLSGAWSHNWAPGDTASATASWALAPGDRPAALTVRGRVGAGADSVQTVTRTLPIRDVPARRR